MTVSINDVRDQLAAICSTMTGWYGQAQVGDQINPGAIVVSRQSYDPRMVLQGGKYDVTFRLTAYQPRAASVSSEQALDDLAGLSGALSLLATIQDGTKWTTISVDYAQVVEIGAVQVVAYGQDAAEYLACPFDVKVVW